MRRGQEGKKETKKLYKSDGNKREKRVDETRDVSTRLQLKVPTFNSSSSSNTLHLHLIIVSLVELTRTSTPYTCLLARAFSILVTHLMQ